MASSAVESAWKEAEKQIGDGAHDAALETLRKVWGEDGADVAQTWRLAGDAKAGQARASGAKKAYRDAASHYESALKLSPNDKQARRALNSLRSEMDGLGIRAGGRALLWDDGAPTFLGVVAIVVALGLLLVALKVVPESMAPPAQYDAQVTVTLYPDAAPKTVESFKLHAQSGAYEGVVFHRIIDNFMVQGGDIECGKADSACGAGTGGYAGAFYGQGNPDDQTTWTLPDEFDSDYRHAPGMLAMANSGANTGGSQFYIVDKGSSPSHLDDKHTIFGMAKEGSWLGTSMSGIDVVDRISQVEKDGNDKPTTLTPTIQKVEVNGDEATLFFDLIDESGNAQHGGNSVPGLSALATLGLFAAAAVAIRRE